MINRGKDLREFAALLALTLSACGPYPRDIGGTLESVEKQGVVRVGLTQIEPADAPAARAYLARLEAATGAKVRATTGSAERQLAALEAGEFDLVLGEFAEDSPWLDSVAVIEPIASRTVGDRRIGLAPVAANGENRWIGVLEKAVRDMDAAR